MPRDGKINRMTKGALTRSEFILTYNRYLWKEQHILGSRFFDVDKYYNHYLETYKYGSKEEVNKWLERKD